MTTSVCPLQSQELHELQRSDLAARIGVHQRLIRGCTMSMRTIIVYLTAGFSVAAVVSIFWAVSSGQKMVILAPSYYSKLSVRLQNSPLGEPDLPDVSIRDPEDIRSILYWLSPGRSIPETAAADPIVILELIGHDGSVESLTVYWSGKGPALVRKANGGYFVGPNRGDRDSSIGIETTIRAISKKQRMSSEQRD